MDESSKYWTFVRLTAAGNLQTIEIEPARAFFEWQFPNLAGRIDIVHHSIQRRLHQLYRTVPLQRDPTSESWLAERCLRCFISHKIKQVCLDLYDHFGRKHGFAPLDLLPYVLNDVDIDDVRSRSSPLSSYPSLAIEILKTFNPDRGNLGAWVTRLVRHHKGLNEVLLEHGVYLLSDWAILNDTEIPQLERIFSDFHPLPRYQVAQLSALLESYHAVYRQDRMNQHQGKRRCLPPSDIQLQRMQVWLHQEFSIQRLPAQILDNLLMLAKHLRDYRVFVRRKVLPMQSLDDFDEQDGIESLPAAEEQDDEINEFLQFYRQQLLDAYDQAIATVLQRRIAFLKRKNKPKDQMYLKALWLFHCQGETMGAIAPQIGLERQDQVTYLLKLKDLRNDVFRELLVIMRDRVVEKAQDYADPNRLDELVKAIEDALTKLLEIMMKQAQDESSTARNQPLRSLFALRLCLYLDQFF